MEANLAVLIDFENIAAGAEKEGLGRFNVQAVMQRFKDKGRVLVARSYADWGRFSRFKQGLLTENVTMMELTSHGMQDKNRADIALVVDALELAFTKDYIDTYVVVSGDSDFTPMVQKLRELNKRVIGCGTRRSTSRLLIQSCDEFIFYDSIIKPPTTSSSKRRPTAAPARGDGKLSKEAAWDLLFDAVEGLQRETPEPPLAGIAKQAILRKSPDFSESELGFGSFTRFLESAQEAGYVRISRDTKSGGYRVSAVEGNGDEGDVEVTATPSADWQDEYIPAGAQVWVDALDELGQHPLSYSTRMDVLEAVEEAVEARRKRRRKSTIHFVSEDVKKSLRRTHPSLPLKMIRGVLETLRDAEQLVHNDGGSVRTPSASFSLSKDATTLNTAMLGTYLRHLRGAGCELVDSNGLAELFLGDKARAREVEEALAWLATAGQGGDPADLNDKDLDDLLLPTSKTQSAAKTSEAKPAAKPAAKSEAKPAAKAESRPSLSDDLLEVEPKAAKKTTAKKTTAKKAPAKKAEPAAEAPAPEAAAGEEDEAKPRRRRVRKKPETKDDLPSSLDALLESSD